MSNPFEYAISLRVHHPTLTAEQLSSALNHRPKASWTVGEPRMTPKGTALGGVRDESYCCFDICVGTDGKLADELQNAVSELTHSREFFSEFRRSGGSAYVYVFWYPNGDTGEMFDCELLNGLTDLGIALGINVYEERRSA